ncbi:hypothetical protein [Paenibacillus sp. 3LSP]|nr:hypothetical protein [Paenibacillus sp. 3LSP]
MSECKSGVHLSMGALFYASGRWGTGIVIGSRSGETGRKRLNGPGTGS